MAADKITVGIDASRCRSGGSRAHLIGILSNLDPDRNSIKCVHLYSYKTLLDSIPNRTWLVKHNPVALERALPSQLYWQAFHLSGDLHKRGCDILFTADATSVCRFTPQVVLSQDLLSYEPNIMQRFGWSRKRARLIALFYVQNFAFRRAAGVIFLTSYTAALIQRHCGSVRSAAIIPHGVDDRFFGIRKSAAVNKKGRMRCIYISSAEMYKNQWTVIRAVELVKLSGYDISLQLVGGGDGLAQRLTVSQMKISDPRGEFIRQDVFVPHADVPRHLENADIFIFASSCETFGITLLEGMAAGLPIACSNRSSLPEVLGDGGVYFDPEDPQSLKAALVRLLDDPDLRSQLSERARKIAATYSWKRCAEETFGFIRTTCDSIANKRKSIER